MFTHIDVKREIELASQKISEEAEAEARWLRNRLREMAEVDIAELIREDGSLRDLSEMPIQLRRLIGGIEVVELFEGAGKERKQIGWTKKVRLRDTVRVLELYGKHVEVSAFRENVKHTLEEGLAERLDEAIRRVNGG